MNRIIFLIIAFSMIAGAQKLDKDYVNPPDYNIIYLMVGYPASVTANNYFEVYNEQLGGTKRILDSEINLGIGTKFPISDNIKIGLAGNFLKSGFNDNYQQKLELPTDTIFRTIEDRVDISTVPVIATLEFIPFNILQFRSYFGLGGGIALSTVEWEEDVISTAPGDPRSGGEIYNESGIFPAGRLLAGVELGFDKRGEESFLGSLFFEIRYTMIFRKLEIFNKFLDQEYQALPEFADSYSMIPGYIGLNVGLSFNFYSTRKQK